MAPGDRRGTRERPRPHAIIGPPERPTRSGERRSIVAASGLSENAKEYRRRLDEQPDEQIDSWSIELMRDLSIRLGVRRVLTDFQRAARLDDRELERVYAGGGGPPASFGRTEAGEIMVPAITLYCLVSGLRRYLPDARARLETYLVDNFHELVFI